MAAEQSKAPAFCPRCGARYDPGSSFCPVDGTRLEALSASSAAVPSPYAVGSVIAERYRLLRLLGEGGMGQVFEAEHLHIAKRYAVKLLRREIAAQTEALARFQREARSASEIGHESIVEIADFASLPDGTAYLAMELLEGRTLAQRLREAPAPSIDEVIAIIRQLCQGLGAAHANGIVHRDVKPENVFLPERGDGEPGIKILDFGIAKMSSDVALTRTGAVFGTPRYMSPEQAAGKPVDHRSDIYSVGAVLFEALCGRPPFDADSLVGMISQHLHTAPPRPREVAPTRGIPEALEAAVLAALAKEPAARPQSMAELERLLVEASAPRPAVVVGSESTAPPIGRTGPLAAALAPLEQVAPRPARGGAARGRPWLKLAFVFLAAFILLLVVAGRRTRQEGEQAHADPPADPGAAAPQVPPASVAEPVRPPSKKSAGRDREDRNDGDKPAHAAFTGVYRGDGSICNLTQQGDRVRGRCLASGVVLDVTGVARKGKLEGEVTSPAAPGRAVAYTASLKGDVLRVEYEDGRRERFVREHDDED